MKLQPKGGPRIMRIIRNRGLRRIREKTQKSQTCEDQTLEYLFWRHLGFLADQSLRATQILCSLGCLCKQISLRSTESYRCKNGGLETGATCGGGHRALRCAYPSLKLLLTIFFH